MEDPNFKLDPWADERLSTLTPAANWKPDASAALRELRRRGVGGARRGWTLLRRGLLFGAASLAMATLAMLVMPTRGVCAWGFCEQPGAAKAEPVPVAPAVSPAAVAPAVTPAATTPSRPAPVASQVPRSAITAKAATSAVMPRKAAIVCEVYSDFECPACAAFYLQTYPQLVSEYGEAGKIQFLHRDFPLPQHPYARLAARYANAAGKLDLYAVVAKQLFTTQAAWSRDGNIDHELTLVLPPGTMQKLRQLVANGASLDASVETDVSLGRMDGLGQTPTMVIVKDGKREVIAPIPPFSLLKQYLDEKMRE